MEQHLSYFSENLSDLMADNSMRVKDLAKATGIGLSRIYDYLKGAHIPSLVNALKLADFFRCPLDFMFGFYDCYTPKTFCRADTVSNRVRAAIDKSGMTRYKLHKLSGISQPQFFRWYRGVDSPTLVSLVTIADLLGCSLDYLVGRDACGQQ